MFDAVEAVLELHLDPSRHLQAPVASSIQADCAGSKHARAPIADPYKGAYQGLNRPIFPRIFRIFRTFLGDFNPQKLPSRRLQTLWEWKNLGSLRKSYEVLEEHKKSREILRIRRNP